MTQTLLVELFTEELPPKALRRLGVSFADLKGTLSSFAKHAPL